MTFDRHHLQLMTLFAAQLLRDDAENCLAVPPNAGYFEVIMAHRQRRSKAVEPGLDSEATLREQLRPEAPRQQFCGSNNSVVSISDVATE